MSKRYQHLLPPLNDDFFFLPAGNFKALELIDDDFLNSLSTFWFDLWFSFPFFLHFCLFLSPFLLFCVFLSPLIYVWRLSCVFFSSCKLFFVCHILMRLISKYFYLFIYRDVFCFVAANLRVVIPLEIKHFLKIWLNIKKRERKCNIL